jgi:hypothetical protein
MIRDICPRLFQAQVGANDRLQIANANAVNVDAAGRTAAFDKPMEGTRPPARIASRIRRVRNHADLYVMPKARWS